MSNKSMLHSSLRDHMFSNKEINNLKIEKCRYNNPNLNASF